MRVMFDFRCKQGHVTERLASERVESIRCPQCGRLSVRLLAAPRSKLDGISGDFPSASDQWEKRRESHMRKEKRNVERHGTYE